MGNTRKELIMRNVYAELTYHPSTSHLIESGVQPKTATGNLFGDQIDAFIDFKSSTCQAVTLRNYRKVVNQAKSIIKDIPIEDITYSTIDVIWEGFLHELRHNSNRSSKKPYTSTKVKMDTVFSYLEFTGFDNSFRSYFHDNIYNHLDTNAEKTKTKEDRVFGKKKMMTTSEIHQQIGRVSIDRALKAFRIAFPDHGWEKRSNGSYVHDVDFFQSWYTQYMRSVVQ